MVQSYTITLRNTEVTVDCPDAVSVLDAFLNDGIVLNHSCKSGRCDSCIAELVGGEVCDADGTRITGGSFLSCSCTPLSDLEIDADYYPELAAIPVQTMPCKVDNVRIVHEDLLLLTLRIPPSQTLTALPGQYVELVYQGVSRSYSLANVTGDGHQIELHIKRLADGVMSKALFQNLAVNTLMSLHGPMGTFFVRDGDRPLIFLATGTGFAPIKAMIEHLLARGDTRKITLFWGCRTEADLYSDVPEQWAAAHDHVNYVPVLSRPAEGEPADGYIQERVLTIVDDLAGFDVYACGSLAMIEGARALLSAHGLDEKRFYYDAFVASNERDSA